MPDPTPAPDPAPETQPQTRSSFNQHQLDKLNQADQLCQVAQRPEFSAALSDRGIISTYLTALADDIAAARATAASAISGTSSRHSATVSESAAMDDLLDSVREIQKAAKQKYSGADENQLLNYAVGERLNQRARLEQVAATIYGRLSGATPADTLPGISPAKITELGSRLTAYRASNVTQTAAQGAATTARSDLATQLDSINRRRRQIQFAADAEWPANNPANAGIRSEFQLPADRPFNG